MIDQKLVQVSLRTFIEMNVSNAADTKQPLARIINWTTSERTSEEEENKDDR